MTQGQLSTVVQHIRKLANEPIAELSSAQLLRRFAVLQEEAAFAALVQRHGPMVLAVCRQVLHHEQDAEDAFQASFLVLARCARSIRKGEAVVSWLHRVALRIALKARARAAKRRVHERQAASMVEREVNAEVGGPELQALIHEEVDRLPQKLRAPFVLCCLEGKSRREAALQLGWKEGTVSGRLAQARTQLQRRLTRRGVALTAGLAAWTQGREALAAVPAGLADHTIRAALLTTANKGVAATVSAEVEELVRASLRTMIVTKVKVLTWVILSVSFCAAASALVMQAAVAKPQTHQDARIEIATLPNAMKSVLEAPPGPGEIIEVSGQVLDPEGKPLGGAKIYLLPRLAVHDPKINVRTTSSGSDGRFRFRFEKSEFDMPLGLERWRTFDVAAVIQGYGPDWCRVGNGQGLILRPAPDDVPITGRVVSLEGKPLAGVDVRVVRLAALSEAEWREYLDRWKNDWPRAENASRKNLFSAPARELGATARTGEDGRFRLLGVGRNRLVFLKISGAGLEDLTPRVITRPGTDIEGLKQLAADTPPDQKRMTAHYIPPPTYGPAFEIAAGPGQSFVGTVIDKKSGAPVPEVTVRVIVRQDRIAEVPQASTTTDAQGRYRLDGLPKKQTYLISAFFVSMSKYLPANVEIPGKDLLAPLRVDLSLTPGVHIHGRITDRLTGKPVPAAVEYLPLAGNPNFLSADSKFTGWSQNDHADKYGNFDLWVLPGPGVVLCTLGFDERNQYLSARLDPQDKDKGVINERNGSAYVNTVPQLRPLANYNAYRLIDIGTREPAQAFDMQLDPGRETSGTVFGPDGKPLKGVEVYGVKRRQEGFAPLASERFTATGIDPAHPRALIFRHLERKLVARLVLSGDEKTEPSIRLQPWGTITGRILDQEGEPVAGVQFAVAFSGARSFPYWPAPGLAAKDDPFTTDEYGKFRMEGLIPGMSYHFVISKKRVLMSRYLNDVSVQPGELRDLGPIRTRPQPR
jgi:RNA polymerase sigma factor (sigma-70 family)